MSNCPAGTSGWYAHRLATGEGNAFLNTAGGVLASCGESLGCIGVLAGGGIGAIGARIAGRAAAAEAAEIAAIQARSGSAQVNAIEQYFVRRLTQGGSELYTKLKPLANQGARMEIMRSVARQTGMRFPW
jgi:hypothetical protein